MSAHATLAIEASALEAPRGSLQGSPLPRRAWQKGLRNAASLAPDDVVDVENFGLT
jgi:hypothetical protein